MLFRSEDESRDDEAVADGHLRDMRSAELRPADDGVAPDLVDGRAAPAAGSHNPVDVAENPGFDQQGRMGKCRAIASVICLACNASMIACLPAGDAA